MKTYGLSDDVRLRGEAIPKGQATGKLGSEAAPNRGREFYVYCPGCTAGQHVTLTPSGTRR